MTHTKRQSLQRIADHLGFPDSETLIGLWDVMVSEREAAWIAELPATARELAERLGEDLGGEDTSGEDAGDVAEGLADLYGRGLVLRSEQPDGDTRYVAESNAGVLMDLILFDRRYLAWHGQVFLDRWRRFYNEELVHTYEHPDPDSRPFRVVPVREQVHDPRTALPYEQVAALVRDARRISLEHCPCRTREQACESPLETCLAFDQVADYMIERGVGREIDAAEALAVLGRCEEQGLVHITENADRPLVLCNCCPCCCVFLRAMTVHAKRDVIDASRYRAVVDQARCIACGLCVERCHFRAMALDGAAQVAEERCLGCGLCATTCPAEAIRLVETQAPGFIPRQDSGFGSIVQG